ncbi:F510_1955 family glycosylhydrolase [Ammoniphilus sp. 3BR4]|uniref:F510_1955 family glycosylhydrolase n=1 Tax=Ammoniphilus sp. 3BR4 TaxID=3158265 RepID=UPI0034667DC2
MFKRNVILSVLGSISIVLSSCAASEKEGLPNAEAKPESSQDSVELTHVHGLGYSGDGEQIIIPAHDGLRIYSDGHWHVPEGPKHDYMGFSSVDNGFYSSGHPEPGSDLKNPFGIVKSSDQGINLEILDLHGEVDFHEMAVGYKTHAIYVMNHEPNSEMKAPGLYYTQDESKTWNKSDMNGVEGEHFVLAVHPTEESIVALGSEKGLFISKDYGQNFEKIGSNQVTALQYNLKGDLYVGGYNGQALLLQLDGSLNQIKEFNIPPLEKDAVAYFAENPKNEKEMVFATYNKNVFLSQDQGNTWEKIADQGEGESNEGDGHDHEH